MRSNRPGADSLCHFMARDQSPRLRLTIQKGLETVRLGGIHGVSVSLVIHLARTFDDRVSDQSYCAVYN